MLIVLTVRSVISLSSLKKYPISSPITHSFYFINAVSSIHHVWLYSLAIKRSSDIEKNPGPKPNSCECLSFCHWNLNSIPVHNFFKLSLYRAYICMNKIYIICLSETYSDSSILSDNDNLELPGYNLVRADNPSNTKRGGVCIYYHNSLPLKV